MRKETDLYAAMLELKQLLNAKAKEDEVNFGEINQKAEAIFSSTRPMVADEIYSRCSHIEEILDLLPQSVQRACGIKSTFHPNIALTGEFSGGKTTLIHELAGETSGPESGRPETANVVIHEKASERSCEIFFNKKFVVNNPDEFRKKVLISHNIRIDDFKFGAVDCEYNGSSIEKTDWKTSEIQEFIHAVESFPESIEKIVWRHNMQESYSPLQHATLIDMPGTGGKDEHENVILQAFGTIPDVVCFVVDTDQGIPSEVGIPYLKNLVRILEGQDVQFYWLYSKPSSDSTQVVISETSSNKETWLNSHKKMLIDFIRGNSQDDIPHFTEEEQQFLLNSAVIDARNSFTSEKDDIAHAVNAFAIIIQRYVLKLVQEYFDNLEDEVSNFQSSAEFNELIKNPLTNNESDKCLTKLIEHVQSHPKHIRTPKQMQECIMNKFIMDKEFDNNKEILVNMHKQIEDTVKSISTFYQKEASGIFSNPPDEIDLNKLDKFEDDVKVHISWRNLFYNVQMYHWLRLFYMGEIERSYLHDVSSQIYGKLKNAKETLREYQTKIQYIVEMGE